MYIKDIKINLFIDTNIGVTVDLKFNITAWISDILMWFSNGFYSLHEWGYVIESFSSQMVWLKIIVCLLAYDKLWYVEYTVVFNIFKVSKIYCYRLLWIIIIMIYSYF